MKYIWDPTPNKIMPHISLFINLYYALTFNNKKILNLKKIEKIKKI